MLPAVFDRILLLYERHWIRQSGEKKLIFERYDLDGMTSREDVTMEAKLKSKPSAWLVVRF